jgi:hypothetical protein
LKEKNRGCQWLLFFSLVVSCVRVCGEKIRTLPQKDAEEAKGRGEKRRKKESKEKESTR